MQILSKQLNKLSVKLRKDFDTKDRMREQALKYSREVIRASGIAISNIHRGDYKASKVLLSKAKRRLTALNLLKVKQPALYYSGFVHNAQKEYTEAVATFNLTKGLVLPEPDELNIEYPAYLCGLGEALGELRRYILDMLRQHAAAEPSGRPKIRAAASPDIIIEAAERLLEAMDTIYYFLTLFDYPEALLGGLRRIIDVARGVIERTRGELTLIKQQETLIKKSPYCEE